MSFVVVAKFRAKLDCVVELNDLITETAKASWEEPGLIKYILILDPNQGNLFTIVEFFNSEEDYLKHRDSSYLKSFRDSLENLLLEPPDVIRGIPVLDALNPKAGVN